MVQWVVPRIRETEKIFRTPAYKETEFENRIDYYLSLCEMRSPGSFGIQCDDAIFFAARHA